MAMSSLHDHAVLIAGAGPTGLMLAAELALADVDVALIERRATQELDGSRAGGLHSRTIEVLDQRGVAERFVSQGTKHPAVHFHVPLDITDFPTRHNYVLALFQDRIERILADWVAELGVPFHRGTDLTGFAQDDAGVDVALSDGRSLRAGYLVGCDGGRSVVRKTAGIDFPGWEATTSWLLAEVQWTEEPAWGFREHPIGTQAIGRLEDSRARMALMEPTPGAEGEPTLDDVRALLVAVYGTDFGVHTPNWISRFTDATRQAAAYRDRRVLLAGDAAHVHAPFGGQGLNLGVQDAVNLGWKLAQVVKRASPPALLDTYHAERHPVAARVLKNTMAQGVIRKPGDRAKALGDIFAELLRMDGPRTRVAGEITGLDVRYELGDGHPLLGRRMPDLDVQTAEGASRVFRWLHDARPLLLNLGEPRALAVGAWGDRVRSVDASYDGAWELPVIGAVPAPRAVLVRPDGYVAWVGDGSPEGLADALTQWFGARGER